MGRGCRGGEVANDGENEQVVKECKQQVSVDWKSETEDRAYCFGSEWLGILWIDVPRAVRPFQDRSILHLQSKEAKSCGLISFKTRLSLIWSFLCLNLAMVNSPATTLLRVDARFVVFPNASFCTILSINTDAYTTGYTPL
ncbi:uncharacterized protein [Triticum aestivum]|uniref:uncharacterized protein n=1 Tax=Triticum aestivum TaxID=4565 RepID=UPI001D019B54|nr:uncharacterized protein LOC123070432 [Triticum aestivum]